MEALGDDVQRCHRELWACLKAGDRNDDSTISADYEYHARQLIRSILAYIEAVTFSVKLWSIVRCDRESIPVSAHERYAAIERDVDLSDKGELEERSAKLRLVSNVRFAFRLLARAKRSKEEFDPSVAWWSDFRATMSVRDRLTHPRLPEDVDVSYEEILAALRAKEGFEDTVWSLGKRKKPNQSPHPTAPSGRG